MRGLVQKGGFRGNLRNPPTGDGETGGRRGEMGKEAEEASGGGGRERASNEKKRSKPQEQDEEEDEEERGDSKRKQRREERGQGKKRKKRRGDRLPHPAPVPDPASENCSQHGDITFKNRLPPVNIQRRESAGSS